MICQQSSFWLSFALVELRGALYTCNSDKGHCSLRAKDCFRQGYFPRYTAVCNLLCYPIDFSTVLIITVQDDPTQFAVNVLRNKDILTFRYIIRVAVFPAFCSLWDSDHYRFKNNVEPRHPVAHKVFAFRFVKGSYAVEKFHLQHLLNRN